MDLGNITSGFQGFVEQSKRVISITYKPRDMEFRQMAFTTALGMLLLGLIGFIITLVATTLIGK